MSDLPLAAYGAVTAALAPHFPDPNANPTAVLEARIVELEEINAAQYAEMKGWERMHNEALAKLEALQAERVGGPT